MDWTFSETPLPYGPVHIIILLSITVLMIIIWIVTRKAREESLFCVLYICGILMIAGEIWKQWFVARYVYPGIRSMWFFPWQLCSMAMYCSAIVPFLKGKAQEAVLVFLSSFSVIGAVFALCVPEDMMRPQILLFCHSFLYHAVMLIEGIAALRILKHRSRAPFMPSLILFLLMAFAAELINVASHLIIHDIRYEANMFYITPFYPSTQMVFHEIAVHAGICVEIIVYLGGIALISFSTNRLASLWIKKTPNESQKAKKPL